MVIMFYSNKLITKNRHKTNFTDYHHQLDNSPGHEIDLTNISYPHKQFQLTINFMKTFGIIVRNPICQFFPCSMLITINP